MCEHVNRFVECRSIFLCIVALVITLFCCTNLCIPVRALIHSGFDYGRRATENCWGMI